MADAKSTFEMIVLGALVVAEAELNREGLDAGNAQNALKELRALLKPVSSWHFAGLRKQHKHVVWQLFPMLQLTAVRWYKQMKRRLSSRCGVRNPWKAIMEKNLTKELFDVASAWLKQGRPAFSLFPGKVGLGDYSVTLWTWRLHQRNFWRGK